MNEAGAHQEIQHPESESVSSASEDEKYRMKVTALREGVQRVLCEHEIFLEPGVSNSALLDILSQALGNRGTEEVEVEEVEYVEDLSSDWHDVYQQVVRQIALLMPHCGFGEETEPHAIVESIEQRLAA